MSEESIDAILAQFAQHRAASDSSPAQGSPVWHILQEGEAGLLRATSHPDGGLTLQNLNVDPKYIMHCWIPPLGVCAVARVAGARRRAGGHAMTLTVWLEQFRTQAAQLSGWQLTPDGKLRRLDSPRLWACPLMAQWNVQHPEQPCPNSHPSIIRATWWPALTYEEIGQLMNAADYPRLDLTYPHWASVPMVALRAQLLAACGVQEDDDACI
jgi:hypothetical protein